MNHSLTILSLLITTTCFAQEHANNLKNWKSYSIPTEDSLTRYNHSDENWVVFSIDTTVFVSDVRKMNLDDALPFNIKPVDDREKFRLKGKRSVLKVEDGYLVAFWRGEFGGFLYWFAQNGIERKLISTSWIVQFINWENKNYAIEGLDHLGGSMGSIVEIKKIGSEWKISDYLALPFAPYVARLDKENNMVIVTSDNLLSVDKRGCIDTLISQGFWPHLYPTSMVIQNNICFIGMRKGVLKFDLLTKAQEWLMPNLE